VVDLTSHARHDLFAIAEALSGAAAPRTVRTCPACGALHRDLLSIQTAIRHAWTPRRPRDLRLGRSDIGDGRPRRWQRALDALTQPLAIALTGLGIAGLVIANVPFEAGFAGSGGGQPEVVSYGTASFGPRPVDVQVDPEPQTFDPLVVVAGASLAGGSTVLGLRRLTSRRRAMR
jgi:hypothetical protein